MEAQILLMMKMVGKLAISVEGMIETELSGALDVIREDTVIAASLHGEVDFPVKETYTSILSA